MTGAEALRAAVHSLRAAGVPGPERDARLLFAHALRVGVDRVTLLAHDPLDTEAAARFESCVARRAAREPVSHIIGTREFYGRRFEVSAAVLDPRPETEVLIDAALKAPFQRVLDLGVGSGCILITLLAENLRARGVGTDLSPAACDVAQKNAERHNVTARVDILATSWTENVAGRFDLIVSNPPYIARDEMPELAPELRLYEPRLALTDEGDGLEAYRAILGQISSVIAPQGRLLFECGSEQGADLSALCAAVGLTEIFVLTDLDGRDRVVGGKWPSEHA